MDSSGTIDKPLEYRDTPLPSKERQSQFLEDYRRFFINPLLNSYYGGSWMLKDLALPTNPVKSPASSSSFDTPTLKDLSSFGRGDFHMMYSDFFRFSAFRNDLSEEFRRCFASLEELERILRHDIKLNSGTISNE